MGVGLKQTMIKQTNNQGQHTMVYGSKQDAYSEPDDKIQWEYFQWEIWI